jgi:hypothetical protein
MSLPTSTLSGWKRLLRGAAPWLMACLFAWCLTDRPQAKAEGSSGQLVKLPAERYWAHQDLRVASVSSAVRGWTRVNMTCNIPISNKFLSSAALRVLNFPVTAQLDATILACALGAPPDATCEQLQQCTTATEEVDPRVPYCEGSTLRVKVPDRKDPKDEDGAGIACHAFGNHCYQNKNIQFCGGELCEPGESYSCDGDSLVYCIQGVRVRRPCGTGMTCGPTAGSGVLDCIGIGEECEQGDKCENGKLHQCLKDSFGKGKYRVVDCAADGYACKVENNSAGKPVGVCFVPEQPECDYEKETPHCEQGVLQACVAGRKKAISCAELGMSGSCQEANGVFHCG